MASASFLVKNPAYGPLVVCFANKINTTFSKDQKDLVTLNADGSEFKGINHVTRALCRISNIDSYNTDPAKASEIDYWLDIVQDNLLGKDFKSLMSAFDKLENHLALRSFISGYHITLADLFIWGALKGNAIFNKNLKNGEIGDNLTRWFNFVNSLSYVQEAINALNTFVESTKVKKDQGSFDIGLKDAEMGKVCTRFPPEPSGYLHIGHAKAALLNQYFAKTYNGKLIVRFDDTNPSKEKEEFEESIKEDLKLIGIEGDVCTHTSDHFDTIYKYALQIIKDGKAYVDDTDRDTMRQQRGEGIPSKCRDLPVEENLRRFEEMKNGTEFGLKCCLRAKISVDDKNKALRDPVIYRCNLLPHHQTGDKWKMYPTYDFACPIVDSIEGVTHALRTIEYRDRNPQYEWFLKNLNLRWVHIWDYSRMNFVYTLLSKRKLQWFVDQKLVTGWDDPRFPTIRGIRRRGMTIEALRNYILMQGASQKDLMLEWDKLWAINKKVIDPVAPRYAALEKEKLVEVNILDDIAPSTKEILRHKKNPDVGTKVVNYSNKIYMEFVDVSELQENEEFTLMDWGNAIVKKINWSADHSSVESMDIVLHLEGDFKKTKKKVTWLSRIAANGDKSVVDVNLLDYDYLITKRKLEEDDEVKDFITPVTEFKKLAVGDINMASLKKGDIIQIERKGYYIVDKSYDGTSMDVIIIPDGKVGKMASKADTAGKNEKKEKKDKKEKKSAKKEKKEKEATRVAPAAANASGVKGMYEVKPIYGVVPEIDTKTKMYEVKSIYGDNVKVDLPLTASQRLNAPVQQAPAQTQGNETASADDKKKARKEKKEKKAKKEPPKAKVEEITISRLDIGIGKVLEIKRHPNADTLYVEKIDLGNGDIREVVSGLVNFIKEEDINQKTVVILKNLKPIAMRGIKSHAMVLCACNAEHDKVELLVPPEGSKPGDKVYFEGYEGEPDAQLNPKKKVFESLQVDFTTTDDLVATWKGIPFRTDKGVIKSSSLVKAIIR